MVRKLRDAKRKSRQRRDQERAERCHDRRGLPQAGAGVERGAGVAECAAEDCQRRQDVSPRLGADEQDDAEKPDENADQTPSDDAVAAAEAERDERGEERSGRLKHGSESRVEPLLAPGEQPEGHARVADAEDDQGQRVPPQLSGEPAPADREGNRGQQCKRSHENPTEDHVTGRQLPHCHLDEQEGGAQMAARAISMTR